MSARITARLAVAGAALGLAAGAIELALGPDIRAWVGNKADTTRLGLATLLLSAIALACALTLRRTPHRPPATALALAAGLLLPGLICFTTVGRLWWVPGPLLVLAGTAVAAGTWHDRRQVAAAVGREWPAALTLALAAFYLFLGGTALGLAGVLGILGAVGVVALVASRSRVPPRRATGLLVLVSVPFALATWWSVVTPVIALLLIVIGSHALRGARQGLVVASAGG
jgi:hypothetical protein